MINCISKIEVGGLTTLWKWCSFFRYFRIKPIKILSPNIKHPPSDLFTSNLLQYHVDNMFSFMLVTQYFHIHTFLR